MGKMALILIMGLAVSVGVIGYTMNRSKTELMENVAGFEKYTIARNIAHTGVNMILRRLDRNDTSLTGPLGRAQTAWLVTGISSGVCSVSVKLSNSPSLDTIDITSKAQFMDTAKAMTLRLYRRPVPFPVIKEALGLRVPNVDFQVNGGASSIDGSNHDINGNVLPSPPDTNAKPAVGVLTSSPDSQNVAADAGMLTGTPKIKVDTSMSNPADYVQDYVDAADYVYPPGTYGSNMLWGTAMQPVIVFANGQSGQVKFSGTVVGWGILVVRGTLSISGTFQFHGLVICYNDVTIQRDTVGMVTGTPNVIGGVLMAGASGSQFTMKGNSQIAYSYDALMLAQYINKLQVYRVLRWYE